MAVEIPNGGGDLPQDSGGPLGPDGPHGRSLGRSDSRGVPPFVPGQEGGMVHDPGPRRFDEPVEPLRRDVPIFNLQNDPMDGPPPGEPEHPGGEPEPDASFGGRPPADAGKAEFDAVVGKEFEGMETPSVVPCTVEAFLGDPKSKLQELLYSGDEMFLVNSDDPTRVHFWVLPVSGRKVIERGMRGFLGEDLAIRQDNLGLSGGDFMSVDDMLLEDDVESAFAAFQEEEPVRRPEREAVFNIRQFLTDPAAILSQVEELGESILLTRHGDFKFQVTPIPLLYQENLADAYAQRDGEYVEQMYDVRREIGFERE